MKIDAIETVRHEGFPNLLFVLVHSEGLVGLGETFYGAEAVESYLHSVAAPLLVGQDPRRIVAINRSLEGYVGYAGSGVETRARSAVDVALWDLSGQRAGLPLHDLMGGRTRDSIGVYNTCAGTHYVRRDGQATQNYGRGVDGRWEDLDRFMSDAGGLAEELLSEGITGMKIWPFDAFAEASQGMSITREQMQAGLDPIRKIRAAVGDRMDVMIELHALWSAPAAASIVRALEPYSPFWVEDPVRSDLLGALHEVHVAAERTGTMIAAGETVAAVAGYVPLLAARSIDVATVDVVWCGGITHALRIAALADAHGRAVAPHDCTGPVALVAATHLAVSVPNVLVQETVRASLRTWYQEFVTELPPVANGRIRPPEGQGLGTALQPDIRTRRGITTRLTTHGT
ncbi:mandelate racemase/muconate lactonizing enzyme family protein [Kineosporia sp. A_224]|uniref:mandelate racemase/muconate lactonizing enzyme family protein n=1 Tax=Kineosporia sp. A_224 TaxID=1962180 RepID=UPI000B4BB47E|nr:mandelate racemase/muconate lactonizing enzyme family protein [Kineosporia sp. A_224]